MQDAEVVAKKEEVRRAMISSKTPAGVQLMDLQNYEMYEVLGDYTDLKEKDDVRYVTIGEKVYIL